MKYYKSSCGYYYKIYNNGKELEQYSGERTSDNLLQFIENKFPDLHKKPKRNIGPKKTKKKHHKRRIINENFLKQILKKKVNIINKVKKQN